MKSTAPSNWDNNPMLITGLTLGNIQAPLILEEAVNPLAFETYREQMLVPKSEAEPNSGFWII